MEDAERIFDREVLTITDGKQIYFLNFADPKYSSGSGGIPLNQAATQDNLLAYIESIKSQDGTVLQFLNLQHRAKRDRFGEQAYKTGTFVLVERNKQEGERPMGEKDALIPVEFMFGKDDYYRQPPSSDEQIRTFNQFISETESKGQCVEGFTPP